MENNLGYYQVTKMLLPISPYRIYAEKGKYVLSYDYICNTAGTFSNGITTMQIIMLKMNAHTQGTKVSISMNNS